MHRKQGKRIRVLEADVRDPVCDHYDKKVGILHVRNVFRAGPATGFPDDTFYFYGRTLHVEFKGSEGKLSRKQEEKIAILRDANQMVAVVDNKEDGIELINMLNEGIDLNAVELEKVLCRRLSKPYRGLVENSRAIEAW